MQRREFLSLFAGAVLPSELRRYPDPATELEVFRLTAPEHTSFLPRRSTSRRGNFLLFANDRSGTMQAYRMDLKTGESRQLTEAAALDPATLSLLPDDRGFLYCDGASLRLAQWNGREREICPAEVRLGGIQVSDDGQHASFADGLRVKLAGLGPKPALTTLFTAPGPIRLAAIRPKRSQVLYIRENGAPWLVNFDGQGNRPLKLDPIPNAQPATIEWTPQGRTVCYLRGNQLREITPDENADTLIASTSQFAGFGINGDSSVFVGASRSLASPMVLLLLRVTRREFTLCEHHATDASAVMPLFTPNSQSILFQSDRHGKPAIYRMRVDKLVESTDSESAA
ncbi:MAG: oligogalacturonate lyase family protein [Acidobacteriota bacterium]|nr:oligogalacturonate lyase family protein [Acidobacteriota bacterium]